MTSVFLDSTNVEIRYLDEDMTVHALFCTVLFPNKQIYLHPKQLIAHICAQVGTVENKLSPSSAVDLLAGTIESGAKLTIYMQ